jgi:hypothetical protein
MYWIISEKVGMDLSQDDEKPKQDSTQDTKTKTGGFVF